MYKIRTFLITTLLIICQSVFANDEKIVYYCVSDKLVGLQENAKKSGFIKPKKQNFTLAYFPANVIFNLDDPFYQSPHIVFQPFAGDNGKYYLLESVGNTPFESNFTNLSTTKWFKRAEKIQKDKKETLDKFNILVQKSKEKPFGAYGYSTILGSIITQLWPNDDGKLSGMSMTIEVPDNNLNNDYRFHGYIHHFTCTRFD